MRACVRGTCVALRCVATTPNATDWGAEEFSGYFAENKLLFSVKRARSLANATATEATHVM